MPVILPFFVVSELNSARILADFVLKLSSSPEVSLLFFFGGFISGSQTTLYVFTAACWTGVWSQQRHTIEIYDIR